ncbi:SGNH/GDSL hydrolase family protein [Coraliomargarita sp. W4R72]
MKITHFILSFALGLTSSLADTASFKTSPENVTDEPGAYVCDFNLDLSAFKGKSTAYANLIVPIQIDGEGYPSFNLWHVKEDGTRELASTISPGAHRAMLLGLTDFLNDRLPLEQVSFRLEQVDGSGGIITIPESSPVTLQLNTEEQPRISLEEMLAPLWESPRVYDESILLASNGDEAPSASLLFQPKGPLIVRSGALDKTYSEGIDYIVDGQTIRLTPESSIPSLSMEQLYPASGGPGIMAGAGGNQVLSRGVIDNQISVSYDRGSEWTGPIPVTSGDQLPLTRAKIEQGEPIKIVLLGDSISFGASASRAKPPFVPGWGDLFIRGLRQRFDSDITFVNRSRGGGSTGWGQKVAPAFVVPEAPDLCIIAFGMNDANGTSTKVYLRNTKAIMDLVREGNPTVEFILVASMVRNEKWRSLQPMDTYLDALKTLESDSVVVADVWSMSRHIAQTKESYERSDNAAHPNDFIVRVYAQVALELFN